MSSGQFTLCQGVAKELRPFPHIKEFCLKKISTIQLNSFGLSRSKNLNIYAVMDGKFEWIINGKYQVLYPGDVVVVLPGQEIGGAKGHLEIGSVFHLQLNINATPTNGQMNIGKWSSLSASERRTIEKIIWFNNLSVIRAQQVTSLLQEIQLEVMSQEIGYVTRVNNLLDNLLIIIVRQSTMQSSTRRDFPQTFMKLEHKLREGLTHQWTVEEMSAMVGLGTTAFTEKVKSHTGFPPLQYLINIRVSEAIKLLKKEDFNITEVALKTGFYSSQHFSTTFKKLTGYTPNEFRKRNTANASYLL